MPSRSKPPLDDILLSESNGSKKQLPKTDYKPDFDEYVRCRKHEHSVEKLAKLKLDHDEKIAEDSPLSTYKKLKGYIDSSHSKKDMNRGEPSSPSSILKREKLRKQEQRFSTPGKRVTFSPDFMARTSDAILRYDSRSRLGGT